MARETYLHRKARERQQQRLEFQARAKRLLRRFVGGSFLIYGGSALLVILKFSGSSLGSVPWSFVAGAALTAPTFLIWVFSGARAFIPREPLRHDRIHASHGLSVRPPDILLQTFLVAGILLLCLVGFYLMVGPVFFL